MQLFKIDVGTGIGQLLVRDVCAGGSWRSFRRQGRNASGKMLPVRCVLGIRVSGVTRDVSKPVLHTYLAKSTLRMSPLSAKAVWKAYAALSVAGV